MVTLNDLSRHLGLSKTQISRALNGFPDVSAKTRARVEDAVRELGYRPNMLARKLRTGRSGIVGLVLSEGSEQEASNILIEILLGLAVAFRRTDTLVVLNVMPQNGTTSEAYSRLSHEGRLDGFVVLNPSHEREAILHLQDAGVPFVVHGRDADAPGYPFVDLDNAEAGRMMGAHLAALGHRDVAAIDGPAEYYFARRRVSGVARALEEAGGALSPANVAHGVMTEEFGAEATRRLIADPARRPTAIVAGNFVLASGVMRALREAGIEVPGEMSVTAHDDDLWRYPASAFTPALTGSRCSFRTAYDLLAATLDRVIAGGDGAEALPELMVPDFVEGASTAPPRR